MNTVVVGAGCEQWRWGRSVNSGGGGGVCEHNEGTNRDRDNHAHMPSHL